MSLRRRLTLSLVTILILFSINVGTHFWGSFARNESMEAYRNSVTAAQLSTEVERLKRLGATVIHEKDEWGLQWVTLADPEGNEFCLAQPE